MLHKQLQSIVPPSIIAHHSLIFSTKVIWLGESLMWKNVNEEETLFLILYKCKSTDELMVKETSNQLCYKILMN